MKSTAYMFVLDRLENEGLSDNSIGKMLTPIAKEYEGPGRPVVELDHSSIWHYKKDGGSAIDYALARFNLMADWKQQELIDMYLKRQKIPTLEQDAIIEIARRGMSIGNKCCEQEYTGFDVNREFRPIWQDKPVREQFKYDFVFWHNEQPVAILECQGIQHFVNTDWNSRDDILNDIEKRALAEKNGVEVFYYAGDGLREYFGDGDNPTVDYIPYTDIEKCVDAIELYISNYEDSDLPF